MLTLQEKLALTMTSVGSISALAEMIGVSRRTMGRWLREGEPEGVKQIPKEAKAAINDIFQIHKELVIQQARADKIPHSISRPVFAERKALRTGKPGERVVAERTNFIRNDLRRRVIADQQKSDKYLSASVRSVIDFNEYSRLIAIERLEEKGDDYSARDITRIAKAIEKKFVAKERIERGKIVDTTKPFAIFTRYADISPLRAHDDERGIDYIEEQLRHKHDPAVGGFGTVAADQILLQLLPKSYVSPDKAKERILSKGSAKKARSRK